MQRIASLVFASILACLTACGGDSSGAPAEAALTVSSASVPTATVGTAFSATFSATGGTPPYRWSVGSGTLPAGLALSPSGALTGTPTAAGTANFGATVTDSSVPAKTATKSFSLPVSPAALAIATSTLAAATANSPYSVSLAATGGTAPLGWILKSGTLPAELALNAAGIIAGTPNAGGTVTFTVQVTDSGSPAQVATQSLTLNVAVAPLTASGVALAGATINSVYSAQLSASGGAGAYAWALTAGTLPTGLTLSHQGLLSGTPTVAGISTFSATVTDGNSPPGSATQSFNILVATTGTPTQVSLAATPSNISVGSNFAGLSYEKNKMSSALFSPGNATLIALFNKLGANLLRIGGNSVDHTLWNAAGAGETAGQVAPSDVDRLAGFLAASHWQVLYGIEFLNEAASPVAPTDPSLVAAEAVYAMKSLGDSLYGFEIGNEPDLYKNQITGFDYATFQSQWQTYHDAIVNAVAAAKTAGTLPPTATPRFTGPAAAYNQAYVTPFAQAEAADIFLLTRHYYVANGQNATSTMSLLLQPDPALPGELSAMDTAATANHIASGYRLSEANSFYNGGAPGISDGFGTSLWAINFLFTNAWAGSAGVNFHGGGNGSGYTPIGDDGTAAVSVRPEYYGLYLFSQAADGQLVATTSTPSSSSLYAYAVAAGSATHMILVNTSTNVSLNVSVQFGAKATTATFVTLTGPSLDSTTGELMNGAAIQADGTWAPLAPPPLTLTSGAVQIPVAAGSALLLTAQ